MNETRQSIFKENKCAVRLKRVYGSGENAADGDLLYFLCALSVLLFF